MKNVPLSDIATLLRGVSFSKEEGSLTPLKGYLPVIRAGSIQESLLLSEGQIWVPVDKVKESQKIRVDDIVMCTSSGSSGLVGKCARSMEDFEGSFGAFCAGIRADQEKASPSYLYHFLRSPVFKSWTSTSSGANIKNIRISELAEFQIPLPSLPEQKRIAAILDKADAIRRKRQQAIQIADDFLRAVFLDMFGDPVTNPKGWPLKRFGEIGTWSSGGTPSRTVSDFFEGEINWYSAGELNSRYLEGSIEKISESAIKNSAAKIFKKGSLLVGMYDTAAMKIAILKEDSSCNQACANVECNELASVEWLYSYIDCAKDSYLSRRRGVRQKNLNLGMIRDFLMPLPPRDLQDDFVNFVSAVFGMKKKQDKCKDLPVFDSLSLKTFSGQL